MSDTVLRIIPGKFNDKPVRIPADHPLYAESVDPSAFAARAANDGASSQDNDNDGDDTPLALDEMTKAELVEHAATLGLTLDASEKKVVLVAAIEAHVASVTGDGDAPTEAVE